jgi:hypothetical protein
VSELRDLIREVADEHPTAQPEEIARDVAKQTPADRLIEFYEEALRPLVVMVFSRDRNTAFDNAMPADDAGVSSQAPPKRQPANSKKAERTRTWWQTMLDSRVKVETGFIPLADCRREDLEYCIDERRSHIADVENRIGYYERLIALLADHGVETVGELPEQEQL